MLPSDNGAIGSNSTPLNPVGHHGLVTATIFFPSFRRGWEGRLPSSLVLPFPQKRPRCGVAERIALWCGAAIERLTWSLGIASPPQAGDLVRKRRGFLT